MNFSKRVQSLYVSQRVMPNKGQLDSFERTLTFVQTPSSDLNLKEFGEEKTRTKVEDV